LTVATLTRWLVLAASAGTFTVHCIEAPCCIIVKGLPKLASTNNNRCGSERRRSGRSWRLKMQIRERA
jgi:hypothetical protein